MSTPRAILAILSLCLVVAHLTGSMNAVKDFLDVGLSARDLPYLLAIPGVAVFALVMLKN